MCWQVHLPGCTVARQRSPSLPRLRACPCVGTVPPLQPGPGEAAKARSCSCLGDVRRGQHPTGSASHREPQQPELTGASVAPERMGAKSGSTRSKQGAGRRAPPFVPSTRVPVLAAAPRAAKTQLEHRPVPALRQAASHGTRVPHPSLRAQRCPGTHRGHTGPPACGDASGGRRQKAPRCWQLARGGGVAVRKTCEGCV